MYSTYLATIANY